MEAPVQWLTRRGLTKSGHPPPHEKLRQLQDLGARLYVCGPSMAHLNVAPDDLFLSGIENAADPTLLSG
jgi:hypothetical protein